MSLEGQIDHVTPHRVIGWARNGEAPDHPVSLVVTDNDEVVGRVLADAFRPDLVAAGFGNAHYGFELWLPERLSPARRHVIRVKSEEGGGELMYSPVVLEASDSFDAAEQERLRELLQAPMSGVELATAAGFLAEIIHDLKQRAVVERANLETRHAPGARVPRALIIDDHAPDETRDAGSVAIVSHARSLRRLGFDVAFVGRDLHRSDSCSVQALEAEGLSFYHAPGIGSVEELLRLEKDGFDLVYIHRVTNMALYASLVEAHQPDARLIYSVADLHHLRWERQAEAEPGRFLPVAKTRHQELEAARQAACVVTHSHSEAAILRNALPEAHVEVVPWSVTLSRVVRVFGRRRHLAFLGGFSHAPNVAAAMRLVKDIMPLVWERDPDIKCFLVGPDLPSDFPLGPRVEHVGHVPDLFPVLNRVRLTVAPLTYGAGVKGKVLESMAHGLPCVMSEIAAEGMNLPEALQGCIARDDSAFAALILRLHKDAGVNTRFAEAGLSFVESGWSETAVDAALGKAVGTGEAGCKPPVEEVGVSTSIDLELSLVASSHDEG